MKSILFVSHGSRFFETKEEVVRLVKQLKVKSKISVFEYAFLEIESPSIPQGIDLCAQKGATEIIILLNFLNSGRHVDQDIPRIVEESRRRYPQISFRITKPVGQNEGIVKLFLDMI